MVAVRLLSQGDGSGIPFDVRMRADQMLRLWVGRPFVFVLHDRLYSGEGEEGWRGDGEGMDNGLEGSMLRHIDCLTW